MNLFNPYQIQFELIHVYFLMHNYKSLLFMTKHLRFISFVIKTKEICLMINVGM